MDHGEVNGVIMLDLRKVFDLISHECLLEKQRMLLFLSAMITQASGFDRTAQVEPNKHQCTGKIGSGNTDTEKHNVPWYLYSPVPMFPDLPDVTRTIWDLQTSVVLSFSAWFDRHKYVDKRTYFPKIIKLIYGQTTITTDKCSGFVLPIYAADLRPI